MIKKLLLPIPTLTISSNSSIPPPGNRLVVISMAKLLMIIRDLRSLFPQMDRPLQLVLNLTTAMVMNLATFASIAWMIQISGRKLDQILMVQLKEIGLDTVIQFHFHQMAKLLLLVPITQTMKGLEQVKVMYVSIS